MSTVFVNNESIVRRIWGSSDTVLFIFAGAAAEFALNKAVDWLYFTGRLPADPLGRLFSTVTYARHIIFSDNVTALASIDKITAIHQGVEQSRAAKIPDWAYRDVLFLLIGYSISSYELLHCKLTDSEAGEVFDVFKRVGERMGLTGLPTTFQEWKEMRQTHLQTDLELSPFSIDLYQQYKKHLGGFRFQILRQVQCRLAPPRVAALLKLKRNSWFGAMLAAYKFSRFLRINNFFKNMLLPAAYKTRIQNLDMPQNAVFA